VNTASHAVRRDRATLETMAMENYFSFLKTERTMPKADRSRNDARADMFD